MLFEDLVVVSAARTPRRLLSGNFDRGATSIEKDFLEDILIMEDRHKEDDVDNAIPGMPEQSLSAASIADSDVDYSLRRPNTRRLQTVGLMHQNHNLDSIFNGFRNGILYGTRIRVVDALVKTVLYSRKPFLNVETLQKICQDAFEHGSSLGISVAINKSVAKLLEKVTQQTNVPWHQAVAGFAGGFLIWGNDSRFNEMMNMYILSRVIMGFFRNEAAKFPKFLRDHGFRLYAGVIWAFVLYQFHAKHPLQGSLQSSMSYLHEDSLYKEAKKSWKSNLGVGAKYVPYLAAFVWMVKVILGPPDEQTKLKTLHQVPSFALNVL